MKYGIGLDLGTTSVGWSVLELDNEDKPKRIVDLNSNIFKIAEHPKDGSSLALPRREARGARRVLRRKKHRKDRIKNLLISERIISEEGLENLYEEKLTDIYELRARALDYKLENPELARVLLHLAQRRGFKSNRKKDKDDKEAGKVLGAIKNNQDRIKEKGYRTVGEMLACDDKFKENKRNKDENHLSNVMRSMIEEEAKLILEKQRSFGNERITEAFEKDYLEILLSQRSFEDGPASGPYSGSQIEKMIGLCTFEGVNGHKRAPKAAYSFEYFNLLQKINHIRLIEDGKNSALTDEQRNRIIELAHKSEKIDYARIRKELKLEETVLFNINYRGEIESDEKKEKFNYLPAYHEMRRAFDKLRKGYIDSVSRDKRNQIAYIFSVYKRDEMLRPELEQKGFLPEEINVLIENLPSFSKFGHLSTVACDRIISGLEKGMTYDKACDEAGYNFKSHDGGEKACLLSLKNLQEEADSITSPVVKRTLSKAAKVVNAIIRMMDESPCYINIELARELSKPKKERDKRTDAMERNRSENERLMTELRETDMRVERKGIDLVKLKLWKEQDGHCPYSNTQLDRTQLFESGYAEVDHIIPYSISFDDSYRNKVLVRSSENRQKGNRLPLQYLQGTKKDAFVIWVKQNVRDKIKREKLLKEELSEDDRTKMAARNLIDTQTITSFFANYLRDHLIFNETYSHRKRVNAVNGSITSMLRSRWVLRKVRQDGDVHHAIDATVVAATTPSLIQSVTKYSRYKETAILQDSDKSYLVSKKTGEVITEFPEPWPNFRKELEARLSNDPKAIFEKKSFPEYTAEAVSKLKPVFVARSPNKKTTGAAHKETVKSPKALNEGCHILKKPLTELRLENGEIKDYFEREKDELLYDALKARLNEFDGDAKKAFAEQFIKPKSGSLVRKVKIKEKTTLSVPLNDGQGSADNGSMLRVDVFHIENDGYYLVPIYVADTLNPELPRKAILAHKAHEEWKDMNDEDFLFSLHPDDLIYIKHKSSIKMALPKKLSERSTLDKEIELKEGYFYYTGTNINSGKITFTSHDSAYEGGLGAKTLVSLEKWQVDVLGNKSKVKKEKRMPFGKGK